MAKRKLTLVEWYGEEFASAMRKQVALQMEKASESVARDARGLLNQRKGPPASPPGSPPARRTGTLARSIGVGRVAGAKKGRVARVFVGSGVARTPLNYAAKHELGLGRYPKRPFLKPALEKNRKRIQMLLDAGKMVKKAMSLITPHGGSAR